MVWPRRPILFSRRRGDRSPRVTPFGHPRIAGHLLLPVAFRSLSRPSSPRSSQASAMDLHSLDHIVLPVRRPPAPCRSQQARGRRTPSFTGRTNPPVDAAKLPFPSPVKDLSLHPDPGRSLMGLIRVELMTPSLSEKCSNRLSYSPPKRWGGEETAPGRRPAHARCPFRRRQPPLAFLSERR